MPHSSQDILAVLREETAGLHRAFDPPWNLAYLALTSKPEGSFRDALACALYNRLGSEFAVAREWSCPGPNARSRADVAVLHNGECELLVEVKATHSWGPMRGSRGAAEYPRRIGQDVAKMRRVAPQALAVALLVSAHTRNPVPAGLESVVKYSASINRALAASASDEIRANARDKLNRGIAEATRVDTIDQGELPAGTAFGIEVDFDYWILLARSG